MHTFTVDWIYVYLNQQKKKNKTWSEYFSHIWSMHTQDCAVLQIMWLKIFRPRFSSSSVYSTTHRLYLLVKNTWPRDPVCRKASLSPLFRRRKLASPLPPPGWITMPNEKHEVFLFLLMSAKQSGIIGLLSWPCHDHSNMPQRVRLIIS